MECDLCTEHFDGAERVPKSLPCGHMVCLQCLRRLFYCRCPTCRRDFSGLPEELPTNFTVLKFLEGRRLDSTPRGWCSGCRAVATPRCWEDHDVVSVRSALRRQLQDALPQAAEQLQGLQDRCRDEQALPALTLLTGESWDLSLRGGGRELTGTLRNTEEPLTKALWLLLATRAAFTESPPPAAAPAPSAAAPTPTRGLPPAEARPSREMDVGEISWTRPDDLKQEKAAALEDASGVTRLVDVRCHRDPEWSLELLQRAAPSLEQLSVHRPSEAHLLSVHAMPLLRRLHVTGGPIPDPTDTLLPTLPPGHAGLQWLSVWGLSRNTLQSLLEAHSGSLEELQLTVGVLRGDNASYPFSDRDLHNLLQLCGLRAMRKIVLKRGSVYHEVDQCVWQKSWVRLRIDGAEVLCDRCDGVATDAL
ncbi:uncharacterized protein LOC113217115 [Frankliniella occidentalis]|uniref:Uncharacterized protein LOC113217115 n=1 Tax=Frankliniella occidentalis TaxID=133901 RepID=A0A9C6XB37_FRAOC|nr:uncharacterized protein LOC113217115 [Frankliniella occidentalis]XP_052132596.1 uncharacterized protein LOC113217115 [Frankliniella occidentalis]XP_052132604.1 uncharacterized protein LOC113217115 [Frankliniella occidentalis]